MSHLFSEINKYKEQDEYKEDEEDENKDEQNELLDDSEEESEEESEDKEENDVHQGLEENKKEKEENDEENKKEKKRKKKRHYFVHHIRKILREICPKRDITFEAKNLLNELTIVTCKIITNKVSFIIKSNNRKTMTESDLETAIKLIFIDQLCQKSIEEGNKSLKNFLNCCLEENNKGKSRNEKADILLPPSILVKFLKNSGFNVSYNAPIFLAGVIEYFISQILELANNTSLNKNIRITINDIENGVRSDKELMNYFVSNNIYLYGSSIIPYTHPLFRNKINDTKYNKHIQEFTEYVFPKTFVENKFKNYINLIYPDIRYQKECFDYFQNYIEKWLVELLKHSNNITLYSKKTRVTGDDIEIALSIMERRNPSFFNDYNYNNDNINENNEENGNNEDTIKFEDNQEDNKEDNQEDNQEDNKEDKDK